MKKFGVLLSLLLAFTISVGAVETPFTDIDPAEDVAVLWAVEAGITSGYTATTFDGAVPCTRGQVVTFLWRYFDTPTPQSTQMQFTDVSVESPYATAIAWAVEQGITTGLSQTTFGPNETCSVAQTLTMVYRAMGQPDGTQTQEDSADPYAQALLWAQTNMLVGSTDTSEPATRLAVVTYLYTLAGTPALTKTTTVYPADQNQVTLPFITSFQTQSVDVAGCLYGALPENLSAGSMAVCYQEIVYFLHNDSQTISAMTPDGASAIWDLYTQTEGTLSNLQIYEDKVYFVTQTDSGDTLSTMNLDGSGHTVLVDRDGQIDGVSVAQSQYVIYDGRIYFLETQDCNAIVSWDLTLAEFQVVYTHTQELYQGEGQCLGIVDGQIYFCQTRSLRRQGDGFCVTLTGADLTFVDPAFLLTTGLGMDYLTASDGKSLVLPSSAGIVTRRYINQEDFETAQDVFIDGVYGMSVDVPLYQVNIVSPTQLLTVGEGCLWLVSLDGSLPDLAIETGASHATALDQRLVVERSDYVSLG